MVQVQSLTNQKAYGRKRVDPRKKFTLKEFRCKRSKYNEFDTGSIAHTEDKFNLKLDGIETCSRTIIDAIWSPKVVKKSEKSHNMQKEMQSTWSTSYAVQFQLLAEDKFNLKLDGVEPFMYLVFASCPTKESPLPLFAFFTVPQQWQ